MTSKEWVKEQLSYTDDHWTTSDRIMLTKILKDLERFEALEELGKGQMNYIKEQCSCIENLTQENEKLKKAIEILKDKLDISIFDVFLNITIDLKTLKLKHLTQQEYELLKEVLGE